MPFRCTGPFVLLALLCSSSAASALDLKKQYEDELVQWALNQARLSRDPEPHGKRIDRIVIVRENVIAKSDPWPTFFNWIHVKTRDHVVRRELLIREGDVWDPERVAESERNLRSTFIIAVARTAACRSSRPGHVTLLVVTKDLWSLRLNTKFSLTGGVLKLLDFNPTEMNFLGRNKAVSVRVKFSQLDLHAGAIRDHFVLGQLYLDSRLFGTRLSLTEKVDFIFDGRVPCGPAPRPPGPTTMRDRSVLGTPTVLSPSAERYVIDGNYWCPEDTSGRLAGATAQLTLARPLYSLATEWGFSVQAYMDLRKVRYFAQSGDGLRLQTIDYASGGVEIPFVYDSQYLYSSAAFTRSFGRTRKHDLSFGLVGYRQKYTAPASFPFARTLVEQYLRDFVPRSETASYFFAGYLTRPTRFVRMRNIQAFALSEDYLVGPQASVDVRLASNLEDGGQSFLEFGASASWRWYLGDDLLTVAVAAQTRLQPHLPDIRPLMDSDSPWVNTELSGSMRNVSPMLGIGRLHASAAILVRHNNLDRTFSFQGGDSGLRGYPNDQFRGRSVLSVHAEYRTLPINFYTLHLGLVAFYDGGAVFGGPDQRDPSATVPFVYRQSLGIGARGNFPQFDKESVRLDLGFPLSSGAGSVGTWVSLAFRQAF
ncbi:MAG: hypothetical protein IT371_17585 [Deltaproteobacteria bacterium]|nr:hypothetical protein [Deltaproteobacteria bacterium]